MAIDESDFYQHRWHFGVLEYIEVGSAPGTSDLGHAGAEALQQFFRKGLPLLTTCMIPDLRPTGFRIPRAVRIWVGIEVYAQKYVALIHVRDATPIGEGHEDVAFTSEYRNGVVIFEDTFQFTYNTERKIFLKERRP